MRKVNLSAVSMAVAVALAGAGSARAQEGSGAVPAEMEEIIVTAQKRVESAQDVPLSVAAFSGETLQTAGVTSVLDLQRLVPNMAITRGAQTANVRLTIRGIGAAGNSGIDPSVGTFVDGVYVPRPGALLTSFNDMAGVEVLRGPQGTLFGRNATVGGILFRTADPKDEFGANVEVQAGNYGKQRYSAMLNLPAGDRLAFRFSGLYDSIDGWAENRLDGKTFGERDTKAGRAAMKWDITDHVNWTVKVDYSKIGGDGTVENEIDPATLTAASRARLNLIFAGNPPDLNDAFDRKSNQRIIGDVDDEQWGAVSDLSWDLASGYTVRLLSGLRSWENEQYESDTIYMPRDLIARTGAYESDSQSHELQLISPVDQLFGGRFDFVAGLYYFQEDFFIGETSDMGADFCSTLVPAAQRPACIASPNKIGATDMAFNQDATNYAIYAQGNIGLTDTLDLVLGARWTNDEKEGSYVQLVNNPFSRSFRAPESTDLELDDDQFTYRAGLNWRPYDDLLVFGSYSTGYKSGGFNSGAGNTALGQRRLFDKEESENIEFGVKSTLANGLARLNATVFRMDLNDFQDRGFDGTSFIVINAGNLRQQGLEIDGDYVVTENVRVFGALGYLDSEFTDYPNASCLPYPSQVNPSCTQDLSGERANFSPEWSGSVGAQLEGDLGIGSLGYLFRTDLNYMGEMGVSGLNDGNPQNLQGSVTQLSARFSVLFGENRNWSVSVFGENLTDEGFCSTRFYQPLDSNLQLRDPVSGGTVVRCQVAPPRTYGVSLRAEF
jgi:iron complex outermembrane receptor protein